MGAEVTSDNIVGYQKVSFNSGLTIVGQQFSALGGDDNGVQTILAEGMDGWGGDYIRVWTGTKYNDYYFYAGMDANIMGDGSDAWGDDSWTPVEETISSGVGMWVASSAAGTLKFSGEVSSTTTLAFEPGLNLMCAPQPVTVDIQDIAAEGLDGWGGDYLRIWTGSQYDDYYFYSGVDANIMGDGSDAWGDDSWTPVEVEIPAGTGFWLVTSGAGTISFPDALAPSQE